MDLFKKKPNNEEPEVFERILPLYSIRDRHVGFTPPIPMENDEYAKRYFKTQMLENPTMKDSPEDFTLWIIGTFTTSNGMIHERDQELIAKGEDYVTN